MSGRKGRPDGWRDRLSQAKALRLEAHGLDPDHTDEEWVAERRWTGGRDTHTELLAFYDQIGIA